MVHFISAQQNEPDWMLAWWLDADKRWLTMRELNGRGARLRQSVQLQPASEAL